MVGDGGTEKTETKYIQTRYRTQIPKSNTTEHGIIMAGVNGIGDGDGDGRLAEISELSAFGFFHHLRYPFVHILLSSFNWDGTGVVVP